MPRLRRRGCPRGGCSSRLAAASNAVPAWCCDIHAVARGLHNSDHQKDNRSTRCRISLPTVDNSAFG
eukprot:4938891-Prymnesium_polylepis.2